VLYNSCTRCLCLQYTDLETNENKFYSLELHQGTLLVGQSTTKTLYRVFTHYGRVEDLAQGSSKRECRYLDSLQQATVCALE
jgi:predicted DNA-binding WGR domain protein